MEPGIRGTHFFEQDKATPPVQCIVDFVDELLSNPGRYELDGQAGYNEVGRFIFLRDDVVNHQLDIFQLTGLLAPFGDQLRSQIDAYPPDVFLMLVVFGQLDQ